MTAPMTPVVAAVRRELALLQASDAPIDFAARQLITAVLDNLDREAMRAAICVRCVCVGPDAGCRLCKDDVDAALAAVRPCPAGGEEETNG